MNESAAGKVLILTFAAICAYEDFKHRSIELRFFILMYFMELVWYMSMLAFGAEIAWSKIAAGICLGLFLLVLAKTSSALGEGDALYFIATGAAVGGRDNLKLFILSMIFIALASLCIVVKNFFEHRSSKKTTIAMLVFSLPAALLLLG